MIICNGNKGNIQLGGAALDILYFSFIQAAKFTGPVDNALYCLVPRYLAGWCHL